MKSFFIATSILFCQCVIAIGQIRMTVVDKESRAPVAFASIYYPDLKTGTVTDSNGVAFIHVKQKQVLVQITAIGYDVSIATVSTAQNNDTVFLEPVHLELNEVVISTFSQRLQSENAMNVTSLKLNSIQNNSSLSLPEKLAMLPGVSQVSTGAGIGKPVIRGLSGNRIAVFSQGLRVENQQWGDEHGIGLDDNGYESVEIIKGPASLLYGSDALGGVIYFVDERYAPQNSIRAQVKSQFSSNTAGWKNNAAFKLSKNNFHWNVFGGYITNKDYADGNDFKIRNSRFNTADLKTTVGFTIMKWTTALRYNFLNENYGLTEPDSLSDYMDERAVELPHQRMQTHLVSSENTVFFNRSKLKIDAGHIYNKRQEFEDNDNEAALGLRLNTILLNVKWYSPTVRDKWNFITGMQEMFQVNANDGDELLIPDGMTIDAGMFGTASYHFAEKSNVEMGLRWDNRKISSKQNGEEGDADFKSAFDNNYTSFNFSLGVVHRFRKYFWVRANVASGFRAPNTFELLSNGEHEGTFRYEIGDIALQSENSYQGDVSLSFEDEHYEIFLNPFVNFIRHYITLQPTDSVIEGLPVYYYSQTNAVLAGGEAGLHIHPHPVDWLHIEMSYSSVIGNDEQGNPLAMMPSQKINSMVRMEFKTKKALHDFSGYAQHIYSFKHQRIADYETVTPAYHLLNMGVVLELEFKKQKLSINAGMSNILNEVYYDHLSRYKTKGINNIGRSFFAGVTIPFERSMHQ